MNKADELIARFTPKEKTFQIDVGEGDIMTVKTLSSSEELVAFRKRVGKFFKLCTEEERTPKEWSAYLPISEQTAFMICEFTDLVLEPKFSTLQALRVAKHAGNFMGFVHGKILEKIALLVPQSEEEAVEDAKNEWSETDFSETSSELEETASPDCTLNNGTKTSGAMPATSLR